VACEVFRSKESGQQYREVWLDPKRNYLPVRYRHVIKAKVGMNAEVEYQPHPEVGWVLKGWKVTQYGHGAVQSLLRTSSIQIDSVQIQSKYPDDLFDIVFPPDSVVYDDRDKKTYQVQSNGDLREQLGNGTLTGSSIAQRGWWDRYRWALTAGGGGLLLGGGVWIVRRRKRTPT